MGTIHLVLLLCCTALVVQETNGWSSYDSDNEDRVATSTSSNVNQHNAFDKLLRDVRKPLKKLSDKLLQLEKLELVKRNQQKTSILFKIWDVKSTKELFKSKEYQIWKDYVAQLFEDPDIAKVAMIETLTQYYGDDKLAIMLAEAKETKTIDDEMFNAQLNYWKMKGRDPDDVFVLLKLLQYGENLIKSVLWSTWVSYVTRFKMKRKDMIIAEVLSKHFHEALATRLVIDATNAKFIDTMVLDRLVVDWFLSGANADKLFERLHLGTLGNKLFESYEWKAWVSCLTRYDPMHSYKLMSAVLQDHYKEAELTKMIVTARSAGIIDDKLVKAQSLAWKNIIKLDDETLNSIDSPFLSLLISCAQINDKEINMVFETLVQHFGDSLGKIIAKEPIGRHSFVEELRKLQLEKWKYAGKSAEEVFKLLELDKRGSEGVQSSEWNYWVKYVLKTNKIIQPHEIIDKNPAQTIKWVKHPETVKSVFNLLKLNEGDDDIFERPEFLEWYVFVERKSIEFEDGIPFLEQRYGRYKLAQMVAVARDPKGPAKVVQIHQFLEWLDEKIDPARVAKDLLQLDDIELDTTIQIVSRYYVIANYLK